MSISEQTPPDPPRRDPRAAEQALLAQLGGWRGVFDSGFPVLVFVIVNAARSLTPAIWASLGAGAIVLLIRLVRRQSPQQAISGFVAVAIAAFIAHRLHRAEGFYLPGIFINSAYVLGLSASLLIRRPLVGVIWSYFDGSSSTWRDDRVRFRAYAWATALWLSMYAIRLGVAVPLYIQHKAGSLGVAAIVLGYPLTAVVVLGTIWLIRRAHAANQHPADPAPTDPAAVGPADLDQVQEPSNRG